MQRRYFLNKLALVILWGAAIATVGVLVVLIAYILVKGAPVAFSWEFISTGPKGIKAEGGIFPTIVASLYVTIMAIMVIAPVGVGAAIYLTEYARGGRLVQAIRFGADVLASIPSIIFGLFGLSLFVYILGFGWSMLSGALTLALMALPIVVRTTEEALMAVPRGFQLASYALAATKWETIRKVILPAAMPRILTGLVLGIGRAFGETAVVLFTTGLAVNVPLFPSDPGRTMTSHLFLLATEGISMETAFGTSLLLLIIVLGFNYSARYLAKRFR